jgi:MscS family membrane protein
MKNNILTEFFTYDFLIDCGSFILLLLILSVCLSISCKVLSNSKFSNRPINYNLLVKTAKPIYFLIFILFCLNIFNNVIHFIGVEKSTYQSFLEKIPKIRSILIIIFFTISGYIFIQNFKENYIKINKNNHNNNTDPYIIDLFSKISLLLLFSISILAMMQKLGIGFGAIATLGGASGIIIGFATKDFFGNIIGLVSIYLDKPFIIGDQVAIFNGSSMIANGVIETIGIRITTIRTIPHRTTLYIPNSIFTTNIVENKSRRNNRLFEKKIKINFDGDIEKLNNAIENLRKKIQECQFIDNYTQSTVEISDIDEQFAYLNIVAFFIKMDLENFILHSNILISLIIDELRKNNLHAISKDVSVSVEAFDLMKKIK